ncbi:MAG: hypothetical protein P8X63_10140 [Desulfuromonadaceae bacterium]
MQGHVNKAEWVALFREIGLSDEAMQKWHHLFETRHPEGHQDFLVWLGIPAEEIKQIRAHSR